MRVTTEAVGLPDQDLGAADRFALQIAYAPANLDDFALRWFRAAIQLCKVPTRRWFDLHWKVGTENLLWRAHCGPRYGVGQVDWHSLRHLDPGLPDNLSPMSNLGFDEIREFVSGPACRSRAQLGEGLDDPGLLKRLVHCFVEARHDVR